VLYTAYFDEADTHGSAPTVIMASFLGTTRQWDCTVSHSKLFVALLGFRRNRAQQVMASSVDGDAPLLSQSLRRSSSR
jgi:hypothetical protein